MEEFRQIKLTSSVGKKMLVVKQLRSGENRSENVIAARHRLCTVE